VRKRLVKTPRLYWRDSGLLHAVMNPPDDEAHLAQPWVGASWEGLVLEQALGALSAHGVSFEPYCLRTSGLYELDLVLDTGRQLLAIEIKLTASPGPDDMARRTGIRPLYRARSNWPGRSDAWVRFGG
jgi:hypothetical protein